MVIKQNLVALEYASNTCYTTVIDIEEAIKKYPSLRIYENLEEWECKDRNRTRIGNHRFEWYGCHVVEYGLIGIYDRTDTHHLNMMLHGAKEATETNHRNYCD